MTAALDRLAALVREESGAREALGDVAAAVRAYRQALRALAPHERHEPFLEQIDLADVATAARARLDVPAATAG